MKITNHAKNERDAFFWTNREIVLSDADEKALRDSRPSFMQRIKEISANLLPAEKPVSRKIANTARRRLTIRRMSWSVDVENDRYLENLKIAMRRNK